MALDGIANSLSFTVGCLARWNESADDNTEIGLTQLALTVSIDIGYVSKYIQLNSK